MDTGVLEKRFEEIYGAKVEHLYFAPGRVNLIGEHIDYNGGRVFPCALSFGTYLAVARRVVLVSLDRGCDGVYAERSVECRAGRGGVGENVTTGRECLRGYELRDYGSVCRGYGKEGTRYCAGLWYFGL